MQTKPYHQELSKREKGKKKNKTGCKSSEILKDENPGN